VSVIESWPGQSFDPPIPVDLKTVQDAIVAKLKAAGGVLARVEVTGFPDKPQTYRLTSNVGACLVIYSGSMYSRTDMKTPAPTTIDEVRQEREQIWSITILARSLGWDYGTTGSYALLDAVRLALTGFQVNRGFTKMAILVDKFVGTDPAAGVWYYEMKFATRTVNINVVPDVDYATLHDVQYTRVEPAKVVYTFANDGTIQLPRTKVRDVVVLSPTMAITYTAGTDYTVDGPTGVVSTAGGALGPGSQVKVKFAFVEVEVSDL
jgi:hypothetical protein